MWGRYASSRELTLLCLALSSGVAGHAPADEVVIGVRARSSEQWASLAGPAGLDLRVPAPAACGWTADLEAHVALPMASDAGTGPSAVDGHGEDTPSLRLSISLDATIVTSCRLPCIVRLPGVAAGEHVITATAEEPGQRFMVRPCHFRLSRLGEEAGSARCPRDVIHGAPDETAPNTGTLDPAPTSGGDDAPEIANGKQADQISGAVDADGRYVAILHPTDDTCFTRTHSAYLSISVTDGFFAHPQTHDILAKSETTVHCIVDEHQQVLPAPMDYYPRRHGPLIQCSSYSSDFTLTDGYVKRFDGTYAAGKPGMGQHDCPPGTICKHDLEDGFMIDIWLVVPEAGQTLQTDLLEGMHVSRFFLVDAHTHQQLGREATVTFFVDHGSGRVCGRPPLPSVDLPSASAPSLTAAPVPAARDSLDGATGWDEEGGEGAGAGEGRQMRLANVARRGVAVQSSTAGEAGAHLAIDGSTAVGGAATVSGDGAGGRPAGLPSRTHAEAAPFWEVELADAAALETLVVWADLRRTGATGYPAFEVGTPLAPFRVFLLDEERDMAAERIFAEEYVNDEVLMWEDLQAELAGVRIKVVRIQLEMQGDAGEQDVLRELALREVQLWAWVPMEEGAGTCESDSDCIYGTCVRLTPEDGEGDEFASQEGSSRARAPSMCVCDANWFGAHCDSNILHSSQHLPPVLYRQGAPQTSRSAAGDGGPMAARCTYQGCETDDAMVDTSLLERTIKEIEAVQAIGDSDGCSSEDAISFFFENRGLAASMLHIAGLLGFAFSQRRSLVLSKRHPWVYTDEATCPQRDFQCYFEPFSKCQAGGSGVVKEGSFLAGGRDNLVRDFNLAVPAALQHKGVFWWRLASVSALWRIRSDVLHELAVEEVKKSIGFEHPVIAMHVRRGDSCHTSLRRHRCRSLSANLRGVEAMAARYKTRRVFLATDSPDVKEELEALAPHLTFISISSFNRSSLEESIHLCARKHPHKTDDGMTLDDGCTGNDAWLEHRLGRGYVQQRELALATLLDLTLLSHADYFVGHFASNLSRLAYLLAVLHHQRMIPYWSVDGPWCYHWRM
jgi:hypothetical protein